MPVKYSVGRIAGHAKQPAAQGVHGHGDPPFGPSAYAPLYFYREVVERVPLSPVADGELKGQSPLEARELDLYAPSPGRNRTSRKDHNITPFPSSFFRARRNSSASLHPKA